MKRQEEYHISLEKLGVGYGGRPLIRDIDLDIRRGEIVTLIGPNGAGKSTILKTITRQLTQVCGKVLVEERNLTHYSWKELSQKMAVVLTDRVKPELMTCHDIVATGRYPYTGRLGILTAEDEKKVDAALATVRATELGERDFTSISDGQKQRVLLARAIAQEPDVIVLDEPTSYLDVRYKLELLKILGDMAKQRGITVVLSLHEIDLAMKISDRIICVSGDRIKATGTPEEIFREELIRELYQLDNGSFDPLFGSVELPRVQGKPEVFVLSAGGSGIPVYRSLQRKKIPFGAGILYTNDIDYRLAKVLAAEVISEKPFSPVSDEAFERAREMIRSCNRVINAGFPVGEMNIRMQELVREAEELGKIVTDVPVETE
uniref:ABC-type cobalamin/Fe3+-siderophore transport system, ATPase component n=1 Tax=Eubacterium cellulosolvens (strain ATCC 43171 / JCM 9499 / 6) TaxID=633697 RepID=I5ATL4_EUBC6